MDINKDFRFINSHIQVLKTLVKQVSEKYTGTYVRCAFDANDWQRIIKIDSVYLDTNNSITVSGIDMYGHRYQFTTRATITTVDGYEYE
ncbi:hypothetical protein VWH97_06705 [Escherichia coli O157]|nr:hypothetical protein [Escherichia coli O157]